MDASVTETTGSEAEWLASLSDPEGDEPDPGDGEGADAGTDKGEVTDESATQAGEPEAQEPEAPEVDATQAEEVGEADAPGTDEPEPEGDQAGKPEATAEGTDEPKAEAKPDDPAATAQPELQWQEWRGQADRTEVVVPGAVISDAGLFIPKESLPQLQHYLADRGALDSQRDKLEAKLREKSGAEAEAESIIAGLKAVLSGTEDEVFAWAQGIKQNAPALLAEAKVKRSEARAASLEAQVTERADADRQAEFTRNAPARIEHVVSKAVTLAEFKDLGLDATAVVKAVSQHGVEALFLKANEDTTYHGIELKKGEVVPDYDRIIEIVRTEARVERAKREAVAKAVAATEAAKAANLKAKSGGKPQKAPPPVRSSGTPAPAGRERKKPNDLSSWEASLMVEEK